MSEPEFTSGSRGGSGGRGGGGKGGGPPAYGIRGVTRTVLKRGGVGWR
jgi:hypothetical protein